MAEADLELNGSPAQNGRTHQTFGLVVLFGFLAAFTLSTLDGGSLAPRVVSVAFLLLTAIYLSVPFSQRLSLNIPCICLLSMTFYGLIQTFCFPQKILFNGLSGVQFWFAASMIALLATQVFQQPGAAHLFRNGFIAFGSAVCLLDLLEQASHTAEYYWLIPSKYHAVFGPFAYWNNFAQFVELVLPVTLWQGLMRHRSIQPPYLILGALQIGSVVASGSRAGTALVLTELLAVLALAYHRRRDKKLLFGATLAISLSMVFIYAAGFDVLIGKLQQNDQLAVRRNINLSSLDMIREHPLSGWGLETYVPVYRMFARYDDGTFVNRAHNDWLQWTAEGGIFFAGLMLIVFIWSIRPAIRSVWGIGVVAICLHALVDYPFARLGTCGWYFALVAMLAIQKQEQRSFRSRSSTSSSRTAREATA